MEGVFLNRPGWRSGSQIGRARRDGRCDGGWRSRWRSHGIEIVSDVGTKADQTTGGALAGSLEAGGLLTGALVGKGPLTLVFRGVVLAVAFGEPATMAAVFGNSLAVDVDGMFGIIRDLLPGGHGLELLLDQLFALLVDIIRQSMSGCSSLGVGA